MTGIASRRNPNWIVKKPFHFLISAFAAYYFALSFSIATACPGAADNRDAKMCAEKKQGYHQVQVVETQNGTIEMKIKGLACSSCVKRLESALSKVAGVKKATVSLEKQTAIIETTDDSIKQALIQAAQSAGFTAQ